MMKCKTIAEYAFRKWMECEGMVPECFQLEMTAPHEALVKDGNGDSMRLVYNPGSRAVFSLGGESSV